MSKVLLFFQRLGTPDDCAQCLKSAPFCTVRAHITSLGETLKRHLVNGRRKVPSKIKERERKFLDNARHLKVVECCAKGLDKGKDDDARQDWSSLLKEGFNRLENCKKREEPYSQMARQLIDTS
jgi:hypothetical protein